MGRFKKKKNHYYATDNFRVDFGDVGHIWVYEASPSPSYLTKKRREKLGNEKGVGTSDKIRRGWYFGGGSGNTSKKAALCLVSTPGPTEIYSHVKKTPTRSSMVTALKVLELSPPQSPVSCHGSPFQAGASRLSPTL